MEAAGTKGLQLHDLRQYWPAVDHFTRCYTLKRD